MKPTFQGASRIWPVATLLTFMGVAAFATFAVTESASSQARRFSAKSIRYVKYQLYEDECASCHVGFLPGFLPQRSWKVLMNGLENHFGEDATFDKDDEKKILKYLLLNSADAKRSTHRSKKIAKLIDRKSRPIRITETPFWQRKHYSIKRYVWDREGVKSKANCGSCHKDAAKGLFSEYDVNIPE